MKRPGITIRPTSSPLDRIGSMISVVSAPLPERKIRRIPVIHNIIGGKVFIKTNS